jgi:hypothetical protein
MDSLLVNVLVGIACAVLGGFLSTIWPTHALFNRWFGRVDRSKRLVGTTWDSSWWRPRDPEKIYHEELTFTRQVGDQVWAQTTRKEEPNKLWEVAGRYDGRYLQLYYWPSPNSPEPNFLDYGCYFLLRRSSGRMEGYSSGHGPDEENQEDSLTSDNHLLVRIKPPSTPDQAIGS